MVFPTSGCRLVALLCRRSGAVATALTVIIERECDRVRYAHAERGKTDFQSAQSTGLNRNGNVVPLVGL